MDETSNSFSGCGIEIHYQTTVCRLCDSNANTGFPRLNPKKLDAHLKKTKLKLKEAGTCTWGLIWRHIWDSEKLEGLFASQLIKLREDLNKSLPEKENAERKRKWHKGFSLLQSLELQKGFSLKNRWHCYCASWDTELFAAVDLPSTSNDNCAIS